MKKGLAKGRCHKNEHKKFEKIPKGRGYTGLWSIEWWYLKIGFGTHTILP